MFKKNKNCLGNCSFKTPYFSKFSSTYCSYVCLLYSVLVIFAQFNDLLKRIERAKMVHIRLLKGVTVPDVLCLNSRRTR
jgi:glycerol-3-phosphate responsive antiterminator